MRADHSSLAISLLLFRRGQLELSPTKASKPFERQIQSNQPTSACRLKFKFKTEVASPDGFDWRGCGQASQRPSQIIINLSIIRQECSATTRHYIRPVTLHKHAPGSELRRDCPLVLLVVVASAVILVCPRTRQPEQFQTHKSTNRFQSARHQSVSD